MSFVKRKKSYCLTKNSRIENNVLSFTQYNIIKIEFLYFKYVYLY